MDRNYKSWRKRLNRHKSLSARRAWIEIEAPSSAPYAELVALRKESVDRNNSPHGQKNINCVALRKESVDRNFTLSPISAPYATVALRKESVDRNGKINTRRSVKMEVALRKESVDRNPKDPMISVNEIPSLSARRAWIEILILARQVCLTCRRSPQGERG